MVSLLPQIAAKRASKQKTHRSASRWRWARLPRIENFRKATALRQNTHYKRRMDGEADNGNSYPEIIGVLFQKCQRKAPHGDG